jgi:hypothetical protein
MTGLIEGDEIVLDLQCRKMAISDSDGIKVPSLITITLAVKTASRRRKLNHIKYGGKEL